MIRDNVLILSCKVCSLLLSSDLKFFVDFVMFWVQTENLEDLVKEKEAIVSSTKAKLASLQADHNTSGSALSSLEELLLDKERQIERYMLS